jgi:hypothetical protein
MKKNCTSPSSFLKCLCGLVLRRSLCGWIIFHHVSQESSCIIVWSHNAFIAVPNLFTYTPHNLTIFTTTRTQTRCRHYLFTTSAEPLQIQTMGLEDDSDNQNEADDPPPAKDAEKEMRNKMINKEEKNVRNARYIVIAVGIACAAAVGIAINSFAHQNEQDAFELEVRKSRRHRITHDNMRHGKYACH